MRGIHRWPVNSPHKWPVTRKIFPFVDAIMFNSVWSHVWMSDNMPLIIRCDYLSIPFSQLISVCKMSPMPQMRSSSYLLYILHAAIYCHPDDSNSTVESWLGCGCDNKNTFQRSRIIRYFVVMMNNYLINHLLYDCSDVEFKRWANYGECYPPVCLMHNQYLFII